MRRLNSRGVRVGAGSVVIVAVCLTAPGCGAADLQTALASVADLINQISVCAGWPQEITAADIEGPVREFLAASGFAVDDTLLAVGINSFLVPLLNDLLNACNSGGPEALFQSGADLLDIPGFQGLMPGFIDLPGGPGTSGG